MDKAIEFLQLAVDAWALTTAVYAVYMLTRFALAHRSEAETAAAEGW